MTPTEKLSLEQAAEYLECSVDTVLSELRRGSLPGLKPGHSWVIPTNAFIQHVNLRAMHEMKGRAEVKPRGAPGRARSLARVK